VFFVPFVVELIFGCGQTPPCDLSDEQPNHHVAAQAWELAKKRLNALR
jgi:hypothetical protein